MPAQTTLSDQSCVAARADSTGHDRLIAVGKQDG
jgi:hypothetical protein